MNDVIKKIKELPILDVIKNLCGVSVGRNEMMNCPFHAEDTPSLKVYSKTSTFKCFGCEEQGDSIQFIQKFHNLTFIGAVKMIADYYSIDMPKHEQKKRDYSFVSGYNRISDFGNYALTKLNVDKSLKIIKYLHNRGLSDATIEKFKLGYWNESAFNKGISLHDVFENQGVSKDNFSSLDRHRGRLLIPLFNGNGSQVIGFASRALSKENELKYGKYINDVNSEHKYGYNKSAYLFGYHLLEPKTFVYVVEGYLDAIFMHELGYNAVGIGGTALTDTHAGVLMKKFKTIVMAFDNDKTGVTKTFENLIRFDGHDVEFVLWDSNIKDAGDFCIERKSFKLTEDLSIGNIIKYIEHLWHQDYNSIQTDVDKRLEFCKLIVKSTRHFVPIMRAEIENIIVKLIGEFTSY